MSDQLIPMQAERRALPRCEAGGRVMVFRCEGPHPDDERTCSLTLRNISSDGLMGEGPIALKHTERVAVLFPPHGSSKGHDRYGFVVRCQPYSQGAGYLIAIHFDDNPADEGD